MPTGIYIRTLEAIRANSEAKKGSKNPNFGKSLSKEQKIKISLAHKDKKLSIEHRKKISEITKGEGNPMFGKHHSKETRQKISKSHKGEKSYLWKGGITSELNTIRNGFEYMDWRNLVYLRDNYTCQKCGDSKGGNLEAHHIKSFAEYPKLRFDIENGITLCKNCHYGNGLHKEKNKRKILIA